MSLVCSYQSNKTDSASADHTEFFLGMKRVKTHDTHQLVDDVSAEYEWNGLLVAVLLGFEEFIWWNSITKSIILLGNDINGECNQNGSL